MSVYSIVMYMFTKIGKKFIERGVHRKEFKKTIKQQNWTETKLLLDRTG